MNRGICCTLCPACSAIRGIVITASAVMNGLTTSERYPVRKAPGCLYKLLVAYTHQPLIPGSHVCCQIVMQWVLVLAYLAKSTEE